MDPDERVESEEQFWEELDDIVSTPCRTEDRLDDTLRTWLSFVSNHKNSYVKSEHEVLRCSFALWSSSLFSKNNIYIRRQVTYAILQEEEPLNLHLAAALLLLDGRKNEQTFEAMNQEGVFARLVQLIRDSVDDDRGLHRHMVEILYETSRIHQVPWSQLTTVDDEFILYLLQIIEGLSNDANDPYHYPVIRVLLVLNEQYMLAANDPTINGASGNVTNRVIKTIASKGHAYKSFGENIILLLNRESETSLQLLILKLLYLLFTTSSTSEYFYTNDLYVLIDIIIRNILDLPTCDASEIKSARCTSLRHTYLRVLHPLLANTQLRYPPFYKTDEVRRTLSLLRDMGEGERHFDRVDDTTVRLVDRCLAVAWLRESEMDADTDTDVDTATSATDGSPFSPASPASSVSTTPVTSGIPPTIAVVPPMSPDPGSGHATTARRSLGLGAPEASESSTSLLEMTFQKEKPGVLSPSKVRDDGGTAPSPVPPPPPPTRRGRRARAVNDDT